MLETRLRLGKLWKEKPQSRPHNIDANHSYIKEYEKTLEKPKEEIKPKGKRK